ncbi:MAG: reverse transcriptase-like protein [Sporolactobacillus sp.]
MRTIEVYTDASSRYHRCRNAIAHPIFPSSIGVIIKENQQIIDRLALKIGYQNSNYAEFLSFYLACRHLKECGFTRVSCYADSMNLVCTIHQRKISAKTDLKKLSVKLLALIETFDSFSITWIPRRFNRAAHGMAAKAFRHPNSRRTELDA